MCALPAHAVHMIDRRSFEEALEAAARMAADTTWHIVIRSHIRRGHRGWEVWCF